MTVMWYAEADATGGYGRHCRCRGG
jgi:hypothetical protein